MGVENAAATVDQEQQVQQQEQVQVAAEPSAEHLDPVARELAEVNAALAAEAEAAAKPAGEQPPEQQPAAQPAAPAEHADAKGNPTAAIIALRRQLQETQQKLMLATGQNQALMAVAVSKGGELPAEIQPEAPAEPDTIEKVREERMALAEKFDAGEISARDMEAQRQALEDREWGIRQATFAPAPVQQGDLQLEAATAKLETDYPVLKILSAQDLEPLAALARIQAAREGSPIQPGALGTLDLRTRIAKLANQHFGGGAAPTTTQQPAALSDDAKARAAKLDLAARMPPDASNLGSAASDVAMSESEILARMEGMTEEEQWAMYKTLPGSVKSALGGFR